MMELRYGKVATEAKDYLPIRIIDEFLNKDSSDSLAETIGAIYKRGAGNPKAYCERDGAD